MMDTKFTPFPILTTERLVLRQLETTDDKAIFVHRSDDRVNTFLEDFRHASLEQTQAFIARVQNEITLGKTILWVLSQKGNSKFLGTICFWNISGEAYKAETGYTLDPGYHKMGYMQEALVKIIEFGFTKMGLRTIEAYTHEHNHRSIQLLLRNKFKRQSSPQRPVGKDRIFFLLTRDIT